MQKIILSIFLITFLYAQEKTFVQEYTYRANESDSKVTSKSNALEQVQILLLEEISLLFVNEVDWATEETFLDGQYINKDIYIQNIKSIIAEATEINVAYQKWNTKTYMLKGKISLDTEDIREKINKTIDKKQKLGNMNEIKKNGSDSESDTSVIAMPPDIIENNSKNNEPDTTNLPNIEFVAYDKPPKPIIPIRPIYPEIEKKFGIEGTISIQFFIDKTGIVTEARVVKGMPDTRLDESALKAVKKSSWEPAMQGEKKVGIWQTVPVKFELNSN